MFGVWRFLFGIFCCALREPLEHFELLPAGRQVLNLLNKSTLQHKVTFSRLCYEGNNEVKRPSSAYPALPTSLFLITNSLFIIPPPTPTQSPHATQVSPHPEILCESAFFGNLTVPDTRRELKII